MLCGTAFQSTALQRACAEQRSSDRSPGARTTQRQPVVEDVTMASVQQSGSANVRVCNKSTPAYLCRLIQDRQLGHNLRSATTTLCQPTTTFAKRAF